MPGLKHAFMILFVWSFSCQFVFGQVKKSTEWPYGGEPDSSWNRQKSDSLLRPLEVINGVRLKPSLFFKNPVNFRHAKFEESAYFRSAMFKKNVYFNAAEFESEADFSFAVFKKYAGFINTTFNHYADFSRAKFLYHTHFTLSTLNKLANFSLAEFKNTVDYSFTTFNDEVTFEETTFNNELVLAGVTFSKGVDFRRAYFDSVTAIYLEGIRFPDGKLFLNWQDFKGKDSLRIRLINAPEKKEERYRRIKIVYDMLGDNFLAQGDKSSADDVMCELGWQREEILGEWYWKLYGWFLGWGYQPWRFLIPVFIIVLIFSAIWYVKYYGIVALILNDEDEGKTVFKYLKSDKGEPFSRH